MPLVLDILRRPTQLIHHEIFELRDSNHFNDHLKVGLESQKSDWSLTHLHWSHASFGFLSFVCAISSTTTTDEDGHHSTPPHYPATAEPESIFDIFQLYKKKCPKCGSISSA